MSQQNNTHSPPNNRFNNNNNNKNSFPNKLNNNNNNNNPSNNNQYVQQSQQQQPIIFNTNSIDVENDNEAMSHPKATLLREGTTSNKLAFPGSFQSKSPHQPIIINKAKLNDIQIEFGTALDSSDDDDGDMKMSSSSSSSSTSTISTTFNNNNNKYNKQKPSKPPSSSSSFNNKQSFKKDDNFKRNDGYKQQQQQQQQQQQSSYVKQPYQKNPTFNNNKPSYGNNNNNNNNNVNPKDWNTEKVISWLSSIGLEDAVPLFRENDITGQSLFAINPSFYGELGISKIGPKAIFENELNKLKESAASFSLSSSSSSSSSFNNNRSQQHRQPTRDLSVDYKPFPNTKTMDIYLKNQLDQLDAKQDVVSTLKSPMNQAKLNDILSRFNLEDSTVSFVIKLFAHESLLGSLLEVEVNTLYLMLKDSNFLGHFSNLPSFIKKDQVKTKLLLQKQLSTIFVQLSERFTTGIKSIPLELFVDIVDNSTFSKNEHIQNALTKLKQKKIMINEMGRSREYNQHNHNLPPHLAMDQSGNPIIGSSYKYQTLPIIPLSSEISQSKKLPEHLQAIKVGKYSSLEEYIDVQFCLLREDMIHPMREALNDEIDNPKQSRYLYRNASFKSLSCTYSALSFTVSFTPNRKLVWEKQSRLLKGSLIGFFNEDFKNVIWGVIEDRPIEGSLAKLTVSIQNDMTDDMIQYLFVHQFDMIESPAYFESYKNVLMSLQRIKDTLPFQRYLLNCDTETQPPAYIRRNPNIDFSSTFQDVEPRAHHNVTVSFPTELDQLDEYQLEAFKHCLRSEISLIQGLPGSGKTFIGRKLFELIYRHTQSIDHEKKVPILLVCYTNHALDQFLMGILGVTTNVIRIGSRSKEKDLEQFNIRNKIKRDTYQLQRFKERDHLTFLMKNILNDIIKPLNEDDINEIALYDHSETLYYQGKESCKKWLQSIKEIIFEENKKEYKKTPSRTPTEKKKVLRDWDVSSTSEDDDDSDQEDEEVVESLIKERNMLSADDDEEDANKLDIEKIDLSYPMWVMSQPSSDFREQDNINSLNVEERKLLYRHWQQCKIAVPLAQLNELKDRYSLLTKMILEHEDKAYADALVKADVVAATTTGASRLKRVMDAIKSKVVIIEEAAEVLESHVISIIPQSIEHLIMIGDHEQLKPTNSVYQLAKKYQLDLSLFERIIRNGMNYKTLYTQRRMVPNISQNILAIYPKMQNHHSVVERAKQLGNTLRGMPSNIHFLDHRNLESTNEHTSSKSNEFEADYVIGLADYLVKQNYKSSDMAILTPYTGQLLKIREKKRSLGNPDLDNLTIRTVDQFQGEEKDIIILSLVRSNPEKSSGFLAIRNRINVSLSRARNALYMVGNSQLLESANDIWSTIFENLKDNEQKQDQFGNHLRLRCENHHDTVTIIKQGSDFRNVPCGGCLQRCDYRLECTHQCPKTCHFDDPNHTIVTCIQTCERVHQKCGHQCTFHCHINECSPCTVQVDRILACGHKVRIACSVPVSSYICQEPCRKMRPDCGHACTDVCGRSCLEKRCNVEVTRTYPCGHDHKKPCQNKSTVCKTKCKTILDCGHTCGQACNNHVDGKHPVCTKSCDRILVCTHKCDPPHPCNQTCKPCAKKCSNKCPHSKCSRQCFAECIKCSEKCKLVACEHQAGCTKKCSEVCDAKPCEVRCTKLLKCRHQCIGICGMKCPTLCKVCSPDHKDSITLMTLSEFDDTDTFIQLDCNHTFHTESLDQHLNSVSDDGAVTLKRCPECNFVIYSSIVRYKDLLNKQWAKIEKIKEKLRNYISQEEIDRVVNHTEGFTAGHWFECPKGHLYYIGECGGAMEVSKCNECGSAIGGTNHALLSTNTHSNIDGSQGPQYRADHVPPEFRNVQFH
ncbi:NF-X1-type zinc finger-containing protein [Cavenderia fasciculata]|uniref:NF-X1-type zinc finger-containing protein n=1 Tax=Cavenderia fasciculata TaxID=261658 RepID=F4PHM2_CACFS|nr:NF-X1-type zinc finger-containing protein [Cavenderia fasciculata]EGG25206.1 NF-X1-type zinc finger-containing protein [Cavenderia fasciculata]|eukprot:XP_004363057.1 NF-X1-type zinc finger-containing protein [Cavenderia fasciculata]